MAQSWMRNRGKGERKGLTAGELHVCSFQFVTHTHLVHSPTAVNKDVLLSNRLAVRKRLHALQQSCDNAKA